MDWSFEPDGRIRWVRTYVPTALISQKKGNKFET